MLCALNVIFHFIPESLARQWYHPPCYSLLRNCLKVILLVSDRVGIQAWATVFQNSRASLLYQEASQTVKVKRHKSAARLWEELDLKRLQKHIWDRWCASLHPLSSWCRDGIKCARGLLRDMPILDKGEKVGEASDFDTGRRQDWVQRSSNGNEVLRKFWPGEGTPQAEVTC